MPHRPPRPGTAGLGPEPESALGRLARGLWARREELGEPELLRRLRLVGDHAHALGGRSSAMVTIGRASNAAPSVRRRADPELRALLEQLWLGR